MSEDQVRARGGAALAIWLLVAIVASGAIYYAAASGALSWSMLTEARTSLAELNEQSPALTVALYASAFLLLAMALFPAQLWIILVGGILFGFFGGFAITWTAAVISSLVVYLVSKGMFGGLYRRRANKYLNRVAEAFRKDEFLYMLTMRFAPICPYCIANIVPAVLGARTAPYLLSTAIGVAPYIAVYSFVGSRAGSLLAMDEPPDIAGLAREIAPALAAFAILPILALVARHATRRRVQP